MGRTSRRLSRRDMARRIGATRRTGASGIALDVAGGQGLLDSERRRQRAASGAFDGPTSSCRRARDAAHRSDIEVLFQNLPEPIDLDLDLARRMIYWTDRGANIVSRAAMDPPPGTYLHARTDQEVLMSDLKEAIGIALAGDAHVCHRPRRHVYSAHLDGSDKRDDPHRPGQSDRHHVPRIANR